MSAKFLFVLLLLPASILAQDRAQKLDAVREFKKYYRKFTEVSERVEAVRTLEGLESPEACTELLKLLGDKELEIRTAAMDVLTSFHDVATFQSILDALPDMKKPERRTRAIEVLSRAGIVEAAPVLVQIALEDKRADESVRYQIARALGRIGGEDSAPALEVLLADSAPIVRMGAADAAGQLRLRSVSAAVIPLISDSSWQVQSSAVKALAILRPPAAIEPLIEEMREGGRLKEEIAETLFRITTLDFGANPDEWSRQWQKLQSINWRIPTDAEVAKALESRRRSDEYYGKTEQTNSFGGITTTSTRVLFIIDISGSMDDRVVEVEKFDRGYDDLTKLSIVKTELVRTIDSLSANTLFNIVAFASDLKPWKKFLVPANIVNRASAKSWVSRLAALGGNESQQLAAAGLTGSANLGAGKTNSFKALMYAFGIDPDKPMRGPLTNSASLKSNLDTVFFLSDGRPSTGKLVDTHEIREAVERLNESYKIVFHCIAIGDFEKSFLKYLAERNGGIYVDLGR